MNTKKLFILEIVGIPFIYLCASLLHFVYDLSGGSALSILFGSVNESVWEHIKIFAVPFVLWSVIELLWTHPPFKKFISAKTFSLYFLALSIIVFFYTYTFFTKEPILIVDLISSFLITILKQYISYTLITKENHISEYFSVALMLLIAFFFMFFSFTMSPPKIDLFKDPETSMYGIIGKHIDKGAVFLDKTS